MGLDCTLFVLHFEDGGVSNFADPNHKGVFYSLFFYYHCLHVDQVPQPPKVLDFI